MNGNPTANVLLRVPDEEGSTTMETLWAVPLGNDLYQLDNSPFYAYGASCRDIVFAPANHADGLPIFEFVVLKSGNWKGRVIFDPVSLQAAFRMRFF